MATTETKKIIGEGIKLAATVLLSLLFVPLSTFAYSNIPEVDGVYDVPGHKNLKVRVFVHHAAKPQPAQPTLICGLSDTNSASVTGPAGWKLPASWTYTLNPGSAPSNIRPYAASIVEKSFNAWLTSSSTNVSITRTNFDSASSRYNYDGINLIAWGRTSSSALGVTYTWYNQTTGQAVETDTIMNNKYSWYWSDSNVCAYSGVYDAQNIMTHELGHWFGLNDHYTADYANNTMYGYGSKGETKKDTLAIGDIAGLAALYGF